MAINKYTTRAIKEAPLAGGLISMPGVRSTNPVVQAQIDAAQKRREEEEREANARAAGIVLQKKTTNPGVEAAMAGIGAAPEVTPTSARLKSTNPTVQAALDRKYAAEDAAYAAWDSQRKARQEAQAEEIKAAGGYYATLPKKEDFAAFSVARGDVNDPTYRYVNDPEGYGREYDLAAEGKSDLAGLRVLNDGERRTYTYLYNKSGKKIAGEYLDGVMKTKGAELAEQSRKYQRDFAKMAPVASSVLSPVASTMGGAVSAADLAAQGAKKLVTGEDINYNSRAQQIGRAAEEIRGEVSENIESPVGRFFYEVGMSAADSLAAGALGPAAGGAMLGLSAGASAARDAARRGASDAQALIQGAAAGIAEGLFERFSIGKFKALKDVPVTGVKSVIGNVVKQMGINASEEALTEAANIITDRINMGELSNYRTAVASYMAQGMSEDEAKNKASRDAMGQVRLAALSGAVMGGAFGGIGSVQSGIKNFSAGDAVRRHGVEQDVIDTGAAQVRGTESRMLADRLKEKQEAGGVLGRTEIGALARETALQEERNRDALGNDLPMFEEAGAAVRASAAALKRAGGVMGREVRFFRDVADVGGYSEDGVVWLNVDARDPMAQVFAHELTHTAENADVYAELRQMALGKMDAGELAAAIEKKKKTYRDFAAKTDRLVRDLDDAGAEAELVADYAASLFSDEAAIGEFAKRNRNAAVRVYDRLREWAASVRGDEEKAALARAQRVYARALRKTSGDARGERRNQIVKLPDGRKYVRADRQVIKGNNQDQWGGQVTNYINEKLRNGEDVVLIADNGDELVLTRDTAGKAQYRAEWMDDDIYQSKLNAEAHIDELASISVRGKKNVENKKPKHKKLARNGWNYRTAYFEDFDGSYYKLGISVAEGDYGKVVYNIGKIEKESKPIVKGSKATVSAEKISRGKNENAFFDNSIPQVGADGNSRAQDVTEMSHSGRKMYISDPAEEKLDLRERVIPEIVEKHKKFVDYEVAGDLAYAMTDRWDPFLQREYGDRLGIYAQTGDVARSLVYNTDLYSNIRDEIVGYGYDLDETDNLAIAEQMIEQARRDGLVERERDGTIALTEEGLQLAFNGSVPDPVRAVQQEYVRSKIGKVARPMQVREERRDTVEPESKEEDAASEELLQYAEDIAEEEAAEDNAGRDGWYDEQKDQKETVREAQAAIDKIDDILHQDKIQTERDKQHLEEQVAVEMEKEKKPLGERLRESKEFFVRKLVDSGEAVARLGRAFGDKQLYHYYNMARSASNAGISMICDAQTDVRGKKVGESLNDIFKPIRDRGADYYTKFQLYMYHMHNIDRMSRVERAQGDVKAAHEELEKFRRLFPNYALMTIDQVYQIAESWSNPDAALAQEYLQLLRALNRAGNVQNKPVFGFEVTAEDSREEADRLLRENPEFAEHAKKVYQYNDNLMQYRVDSGLVDEAFAKKLKEIYPHYVPTFRMMGEQVAKQSRLNQVQIGKTVGRADGSRKKLKPLHKAMAEQTLSVVRSGSQNRFGLRLLEDVEKNRPPEFNTRDIESMKAAIEASPSVLQREVLDVEEIENSVTADTFDDDLIERKDLVTNTFIIRDGDKRWKLTVSPALYEAVYVLKPDIKETNAVTKAVRAINDVYKKIITAWNPIFLVRNFIRDLQDAGLYSGNAVDFVKKYPQAWREMSRNGELWQQYKALGGTFSSLFDYETGTEKKVPKWQKKTAGRVEALNMAIEQAPRLSEFMAVRERLMKEKGETEASMDTLMEAMYAAADITTNFGRSGTWGKMLNQNYIPFLNPGIQGFDKLVRWVSGEKTAQEWARLAAHAAVFGIAPAVINALAYSDDEEWEELNSRDKDVYYLYKVKPGTWLKLPKGRAASLFGMAVNMADDAIRGNDVRMSERLSTAASQVAPANPLQENILKAWFDADLFDKESAGKTWYGGDIEPQRLRDLAPGERYDEKTDELSKLIGKVTGLSPKKINYLLDSYSGVVGDVVLPLLTPRAERGLLSSAFTLSSKASNRLNSDFYDTMDELTYAKNRPGASGVDTVMYRFWNKQASAVSDINKAIREIESDADLKDREKRELINAQYDVRNAVQREARSTYDKYRESAEYWYSRATGEEDEKIDYAYLMANKEVFGAEYAIEVYNKATYEKARRLHAEGVSYDHFFYMQFTAKKAAESAEIESNELRGRIMALNAGQEEKKALYRGFVSTTRDDDIAAFDNAGMRFEDFLEVQNAYAEIDRAYSSAGDKQNAFARWMRGKNYSALQRKAIEESFAYFYSIPAKEKSGGKFGITLPTMPEIKLPEIKMPSLPQINLPGFGG